MDTGSTEGVALTAKTFEVEGETVTIVLNAETHYFTAKSNRVREVGSSRTWSAQAWTRRMARKAARDAERGES